MKMKVKNKIIKFISATLIFLMIVPSFLLSEPKKAEAFGSGWLIAIFTGKTSVETSISAGANVTSTSVLLKNVAKEVLRQIIMTIQKRLLAEMTKSMVNWINSGFHGAPLFMQNPESFFRDIAKYEIKTLISVVGYDPNRFPFGKAMALSTINQFNRTFEQNAAYSLSEAIKDPAVLGNLRNNFNFGGWNQFLVNTQYPQNNYLGFHMIYTEELARRLDGTVQNKAEQVKKTLDRGAGFLSPQKCMDPNTKYNNGYNEFVRPSFKEPPYNPPAPEYEYDPVDGTRTETAESKKRREDYAKKWQADEAVAKAEWNKTNYCKNLVATTPGSVVANQIVTAMSSNFRQTELGAALGSSMSAIFDALLNKFIGDGLSALASTINPPPPKDDFTYEGMTLGGPNDSTSENAWDAGPDEVVILDNFKKILDGKTEHAARAGDILGQDADGKDIIAKGGEIISEIGDTGNGTYTPGDIDSTKTELALIDNNEPGNPGIVQMISLIWPKIRELDMCIPGPNIGWQDRLIGETDRNSQKLQEKANDQDGEKAAEAQFTYKELEKAVSSYKDWVNQKMLFALPNSITFMDAVKDIDNLYQESKEVMSERQRKTETLARLEAIKTNLSTITTQPQSGSIQEKTLMSLWKKYKAVQAYISSTTTIEEKKNELFTDKNKKKNLDDMVTLCNQERRGKGWSTPGGEMSTTSVADSYGISGTEKKVFCDAPLMGGYKHEMFRENKNGENYTITHPDLPLVNGYNLLKQLNKWKTAALTAIFSIFGISYRKVNIQLSCNIIYRAGIMDYKQDLPGPTNITETNLDIPDDSSDGTEVIGVCTVPDGTDDLGMPKVKVINTRENDCYDKGGTWTPATGGNGGTGVGCYINGTLSAQWTTIADCNIHGGTWR